MEPSALDNGLIKSKFKVKRAFISFKSLFTTKRNIEQTDNCKKADLSDDRINTSAKQSVNGVIHAELFLAEGSKDHQHPQSDISDEMKSISSGYLPSIYPPTFNMAKSSTQIDEPEMNRQKTESSVFSSLKSFFSNKRKSALPKDCMPTQDYAYKHAAIPADQKISDTHNILTSHMFPAESRESLVSIDLEDDQDINNNSIVSEPEACSCIPIQTSIKQSIVQGIQRIFRIKSKYWYMYTKDTFCQDDT